MQTPQKSPPAAADLAQFYPVEKWQGYLEMEGLIAFWRPRRPRSGQPGYAPNGKCEIAPDNLPGSRTQRPILRVVTATASSIQSLPPEEHTTNEL